MDLWEMHRRNKQTGCGGWGPDGKGWHPSWVLDQGPISPILVHFEEYGIEALQA
jgi:hypothetical protein